MKLRYLFLELVVILVFLVLPPAFIKQGSISSSAVYLSWTTVFQIILSIMLDMQHHHYSNKNSKNIPSFIYFYHGSLTLGLLMIIYAIFQVITILLRNKISLITESPFSKPDKFIFWLLFIFDIAIAAYYEEIIYRQFLPETFNELLKKTKIPTIIIEAFSVILFALGHRYLGWIAVFNALCCGIILRICCIKTKSCYIGATVHFIYNLCLYLFFFFV